MDNRDLECEYLVIGSGPGGAVTALVLAEAGHDVLVVEEGIDGAGGFRPYSLDEMNHLFRYGGIAMSRGKPSVSYLEGCCLGGASEINAGLYHRVTPELLDQWQKEYAVQELNPDKLGLCFDINEKIVGLDLAPRKSGPTSAIMARGAQRLGWKTVELARLWDYGQTEWGHRRSMTRSFIPQARRAGTRFKTQTRVQKIFMQGSTATGALCISFQDKQSFKIRFQQVFVCGGAVQTPLLLLKSGVTKNIGRRLKMHLSVRMVARFDEEASDPQEGVSAMQVAQFKPQLTIGASYSSPAYLALWLAGRPDFAKLMRSPSKLAIFHTYFNIPSSAQIAPGFWGDEVKMDLKPEDDDCVKDAQDKMRQMLAAADAREIFSSEDLSTIHLFASCPMGEDRSRCALDSFGRVHGLKNVYVNDASMLPDSPGTNPQAVIMALARRNVMHWLAQGGKQI